jgi:uncharacterized membrane-anchored protein
MQRKHIPSMGPRYWAALSIVSVFGANLGDFAAHDLRLGYALGLAPMAALLAAILIVERRDNSWNQAFYWLAIIVIRAAATNLADLATLDLRLGSVRAAAGLTVLLALALLFGRLFSSKSLKRSGGGKDLNELPSTDAGYWTAMLIAGTLGTVIGDFSSYELDLGTRNASLALGALLVFVLSVGSRSLFATVSYYWFTIVVVRAAGTAVADFLAGSEFLSLGLAKSTFLTGMLFTLTVLVWRDQGNYRLRTS